LSTPHSDLGLGPKSAGALIKWYTTLDAFVVGEHGREHAGELLQRVR
ncbi:unnamed protein product, partial [Ectocarpus sp. 6 AP-2014]